MYVGYLHPPSDCNAQSVTVSIVTGSGFDQLAFGKDMGKLVKLTFSWHVPSLLHIQVKLYVFAL